MKGNCKKRATLILITCAGGILLLSVSFKISVYKHHYYLNLSESAPLGLYRVIHTSSLFLKRGDMVVFSPPEWAEPLVYGRSWLPRGWPLLKYVGALEGDTYCVLFGDFFVNGKYIGKVSTQDSQGLPLYPMKGCHTVEYASFLPVSSHIPNSFDGRYMGAVSLSCIIGKAYPVKVL